MFGLQEHFPVASSQDVPTAPSSLHKHAIKEEKRELLDHTISFCKSDSH